MATLHHPGPDGVGFLLDGPVCLAHSRLAIIDLAGGVQPGHRFSSRSDCEVLVHLYEEYGIDPARLTGSLLRAHARIAFAAGAHSVSASFLGSESVSSAFFRAGYFMAETPGERVFVAKDMALGEVTLSQCYLTTYDNDD